MFNLIQVNKQSNELYLLTMQGLKKLPWVVFYFILIFFTRSHSYAHLPFRSLNYALSVMVWRSSFHNYLYQMNLIGNYFHHIYTR
jgi:hypothetical protein